MKGCLSSADANQAAADGVRHVFPDADIVQIPVSDGGEGFIDAFRAAIGGTLQEITVRDPMMRYITAKYLLRDQEAVIEIAQASGLTLLSEEERNPMVATSYGTGQLIADAVRKGARRIIVGLGGSATSDAGIGMLRALIDTFAKRGRFDDITELKDIQFTIASDVKNPLCGVQGAAHIFALLRRKVLLPRWWSVWMRVPEDLPRYQPNISVMTVPMMKERVLLADWDLHSSNTFMPLAGQVSRYCLKRFVSAKWLKMQTLLLLAKGLPIARRSWASCLLACYSSQVTYPYVSLPDASETERHYCKPVSLTSDASIPRAFPSRKPCVRKWRESIFQIRLGICCPDERLFALRKLQTEYIDLLLIHQAYGDVFGTWRAMEKAYRAGKVRAIGVSNFQAGRFFDFAHYVDVKPMVNQLECNTLSQQTGIEPIHGEFGTKM